MRTKLAQYLVAGSLGLAAVGLAVPTLAAPTPEAPPRNDTTMKPTPSRTPGDPAPPTGSPATTTPSPRGDIGRPGSEVGRGTEVGRPSSTPSADPTMNPSTTTTGILNEKDIPGHASALSPKEARATQKAINDLHKVNNLEIALGALARDRASSDGVKDYGRELVAAHQASDKKLAEFASSKGFTLGDSAAPTAQSAAPSSATASAPATAAPGATSPSGDRYPATGSTGSTGTTGTTGPGTPGYVSSERAPTAPSGSATGTTGTTGTGRTAPGMGTGTGAAGTSTSGSVAGTVPSPATTGTPSAPAQGTANAPGTGTGTPTAAPERTGAVAADISPQPAPELDAEGRRTVAKLEKLSGEQFDKQFLITMVRGHSKTLNQIKTFEKQHKKNLDFTALLSDTRAMVEGHLQRAKELQRGASASAPSPSESGKTLGAL